MRATPGSDQRAVGEPALTWLEKLTAFCVPGFLACACFSIAAMQILWIGGAVFWIAGLVLARRGYRDLPLLGFFSAFMLASLLSGALAGDWRGGLDAARENLTPLVFFFVLNNLRSRAHVERALFALVVAAALAAVLGIAQVATYGTLYRAGGTLGYMTYAGVLQMPALLVLALLLHGSLRRRKALWLLALALILCALFLSQTRGVWLGVLVGSAFLLWGRHRRLLALLPLAALLVFALGSQELRGRILSFNLENHTVQTRLYMWRTGIEMWKQHPLLGVGRDEVYDRYPEFAFPDDPTPLEERPNLLHSNLVQTLAAGGLVGLSIWIALYATFLVHAFRQLRRSERADSWSVPVVAGSIAGILAFLVEGLFSDNFADSEVVTVSLAVMALPYAVGAILAGRRDDPPASPDYGEPGP